MNRRDSIFSASAESGTNSPSVTLQHPAMGNESQLSDIAVSDRLQAESELTFDGEWALRLAGCFDVPAARLCAEG